MFRFLPFLSLFVFLAGWMPVGPTPVKPADTGPTFTATAEASEAHDDGEAHGNIDPHG